MESSRYLCEFITVNFLMQKPFHFSISSFQLLFHKYVIGSYNGCWCTPTKRDFVTSPCCFQNATSTSSGIFIGALFFSLIPGLGACRKKRTMPPIPVLFGDTKCKTTSEFSYKNSQESNARWIIKCIAKFSTCIRFGKESEGNSQLTCCRAMTCYKVSIT